ncbi:MAG: hypothetical protein M3P93_07020 [Actinomycetota bacterium]|nr:hypothetical protein [Actinomycetota bacterium]
MEFSVPVHTPPRAVTNSLPTASEKALGLGCARCGSATRLDLTLVDIERGRSFLRSHTPCLATGWDA